MNFTELKTLLSEIEEGSFFKFNLSFIDEILSEELDDFTTIIDNELNLFQAKYEEINERILSLFGEVRLKKSNAYFEVRIVFIDNNPLDYFITIEPNGNWINKVNTKIKNVLKLLPVGFGETMFIHSSVTIDNATIEFDENRLYEVAINKGNSLATHIKSDLLKIIKLSDTLFFIEKNPQGIYKIFKELKSNINLAGLLDINLNRINIVGKESLSLDGLLKLPFPGGDNLLLDCSVSISKQRYHTRIKLEDNIRLPIQELLKGLNISNVEFDFQGSFINPTDLIYGLAGDFAIGEPVLTKNVHDFEFQTLKNNEFNLKFNPTSSSYIPVFIQAYVNEVSMSKAITLITGKDIALPDFIDPIKLYSTYIYYCAPNQQNLLINGVEAKNGIAISSGINLLGLDAYCEYSALENEGTTGNIIIEPINLANLITIKGEAKGTPTNYLGPKIEPGGIQLFFDSKGPIYFRTDVSIDLFGIFNFKTGANIQEKGLQFYYDINLGIVTTQFDCLFKSINDFQLEANFDAKLLGLKADFGDLGKLTLNLSVFAELYFSIKSQSSDGIASLNIGFRFNGSQHKISLSLSVNDLKNIESYIREEILKFIKNLIFSPLEWLIAVGDELIQLGENIIEEAKLIAKNLKEEFGKAVNEAAELLKNAGYEAEKTARILLDGFNQTQEEIASLLSDVGYKTQEIADALINIIGTTATEVFKLLKELGKPIEEIGIALKSFGSELEKALKDLNLNEEQAAALLKGIGKTVEEQARILKDVLGIGRDVTDTALKTVGNVANEVTKAIDKVFGVLGGGGGCTKNCVGSGVLKVCVCI